MGRRPSGRFGTGRGTLGVVQNGSEDPRGRPEWVGGHSGRFGTGQGTLGKVRAGSETLGEFWDGSFDSWGGPGRVGGIS